MSTQHTGPWAVEPGGARLINLQLHVISASDGLGPVAYSTSQYARRIASVPDLLDALCEAKRLLQADAPNCALEVIEAAISKATGSRHD